MLVSKRSLPIVGLFILIAITLAILGQYHQRAAHFYFDGIAIRDTGTMFQTLISKKMMSNLFSLNVTNPLYPILNHVEGPLQFFVLNFYENTIGYFLPLTPSVMQFPNTIFIFLTSVILFFIGCKLDQPKTGYISTLCFILSPWVVVCQRLPWYFNTLEVLLQTSTIYYYYRYLDDNSPGSSKVMAPISLALYMTTGLDWPIFFTFLAIFFGLAGPEHWKRLLRNKYNVFPMIMVVYHCMVPLVLYYSAGWTYAQNTMLFYPFVKGSQGSFLPGLNPLLSNSLGGIGLQVFSAIAFLIAFIVNIRRRQSSQDVKMALLVAVCVWFCISALAVFKTSATIEYVYVMSVPTAILSGLFLARFGRYALLTCILSMVAFWMFVFETRPYSSTFIEHNNDDRHVLAAAAFIIENYPEFLKPRETVFVPRNRPTCVAQYLRGGEQLVIMPPNFPSEMRIHSVASPMEVLRPFVKSYNDNDKILANWLILDSDLFSDSNPSREFFVRMKNDKHICWLGRFSQGSGNALYIGRVCEYGNVSIESSPEIDADKYAELYLRKYDKIPHLKRNLAAIGHY